jgi:hypothetical protein
MMVFLIILLTYPKRVFYSFNPTKDFTGLTIFGWGWGFIVYASVFIVYGQGCGHNIQSPTSKLISSTWVMINNSLYF